MTSQLYLNAIPPTIPGDTSSSVSNSKQFLTSKPVVTVTGNVGSHTSTSTALVSNKASGTFYFPDPTDTSASYDIFISSDKLGPNSVVNASVSGGDSSLATPGVLLVATANLFSDTNGLFIFLQVEVTTTLDAPVYVNYTIS